MSTIKGIFEPFYKHITDQLNQRKRLLLKSANISSIPFDLTEKELEEQIFLDELKEQYPEMVSLPSTEVNGGNFRDENFLTYTTERQCTIRMASGVDVKEKNNLLEEVDYNSTGNALARRWVLESGIKGQSSGFEEGGYGDPTLRSDIADSFGIVPMPGITDASIETQSDDGAIRAATVNFVCYNRRQLEILEALYMRPGYPLLLEWGWIPYISNDGKIERDEFSMLEEFLDSTSNLNTLNEKISGYKIDSGGNYDGFVGFCKNFSFKVREDGGYDCATEIMAHGEILDSLRTQSTIAPKLRTVDDVVNYNRQQKENKEEGYITEYEIIDRFLYYLRSIKVNLDKAGDKTAITYHNTEKEVNVSFKTKEQSLEIDPLMLPQINSLETTQYSDITGVSSQSQFINDYLVTWNISGEPTVSDKMSAGRHKLTYVGYQDEDGNFIPINRLNKVDTYYSRGFTRIVELVRDVSKVSIPELRKQMEGFEKAKEYKYNKKIKNNSSIFNFFNNLFGNADKDRKIIEMYMRNMAAAGLDPILEGTILKEVSTEQETNNNSGIRKKIFVRWDLICQILNQLVTPQYKKDHSIVELTYLNPNAYSWAPTQPVTSGKVDDGEGRYYLSYSTEEHTYNRIHDPNYKPLTPEEKKSKLEELGVFEYAKYVREYQKDDPLYYNQAHPEQKYSTMGHSFDRDICLMPHQIGDMKKAGTPAGPDDGKATPNPDFTINQFTSYKNTGFSERAIGGIYFNLDYLISTYEDLVLENYKVAVGNEETTQTKIKENFNFHDWIKTVWGGVNDACGGYYNFKLHTEHSRPHVARIIDMTFSGKVGDLGRPLFYFDPQGLGSIARESYISSKIDSDMSSVISIAAQAPNDIHSLDAMSFKAFHKNIKNRFTTPENDLEDILARRKEQEQRYKRDVINYNDALASLQVYIMRLNMSNYETELVRANPDLKTKKYLRKPMSPDYAKSMASNLEEMKHEIDMRHGEVENGVKNNTANTNIPGLPYVGSYREDTTFHRSAIIPITVNMTIDGIGGIHPLQTFKINPDRLPLGYQDPKIVFVVKKESQKITSGQDWTTTLEGYLTLLNTNPNPSETSTEYLETETKKGDELEKITNEDTEWGSPFADGSTQKVNSPFPLRASHRDTTSTYYKSYHGGTDLACAADQQLLAAQDGTVESVDNLTGYGKTLIVKLTDASGKATPDDEHKHHKSNMPAAKYLYAHMNTIDVKVGDFITKGTPVGTCGNTHNTAGEQSTSMGVHLHYEIGTSTAYTPYFWNLSGTGKTTGGDFLKNHEKYPGELVGTSGWTNKVRKLRIENSLIDPFPTLPGTWENSY